MRKVFLVLILALFLGISPIVSANQNSNNSSDGVGVFQTFIRTLGDWQTLKQKNTEKKISLTYEEGLTFPSLEKIKTIEVQLEETETELEVLQNQYLELEEAAEQSVFLKSIEEKQEQIEKLQSQKEEYENTYASRKEKQQSNIKTLKDELEDLRENIEKQEKLIKAQLYKSLASLGMFVGVILLLFVIRFISAKLILHFSSHLNEKRQIALLQLNKVSFNILITIVLLGLVSSQFISILPVIALIGTGLAFAIRDALSCFMGWFLIGTERGYRTGQIIKVRDSYGRVQEVSAFVTVLREIQGNRETGKTISFPNKVIFEDEIINFSHCQNFVQEEVEFLITENSNLSHVKSVLLDIINNQIAEDQKQMSAQGLKISRQCAINQEEQKPFVWIQITENGVLLSGKFFAQIHHSKRLKFAIMEDFIMASQKKSADFSLHFTDVGRNSQSLKQK